MPGDRADVSLNYLFDPLNLLIMFIFADQANARPLAVSDVVFKTDPEFPFGN